MNRSKQLVSKVGAKILYPNPFNKKLHFESPYNKPPYNKSNLSISHNSHKYDINISKNKLTNSNTMPKFELVNKETHTLTMYTSAFSYPNRKPPIIYKVLKNNNDELTVYLITGLVLSSLIANCIACLDDEIDPNDYTSVILSSVI